jgi:hypothetical protein
MISGQTMNKVYEMMDGLTVDQIKEARDNHGHKVLINLGTDAYKLFIYQCNYMIDKKQGKILS